MLFLASACSTSRRGTKADKIPGQETAQPHKPHRHSSSQQKKLVKEAEKWLGTPYLYGAQEKGKGTDCSGLVMMVYLEALEVKLPRNSAKQAAFCRKIKEEEVLVGDLVFFATGKDPDKVTHVGMMVDDDGTFIHASSSKGVVRSSMKNQWYRKRFLMYGRVPT